MRPILFRIPLIDLPIFSYGFMIMLGFMFAMAYGAWRAKREGEDPNHVLDVGLYAVVSGVLGARLFYYFEFYQRHFSDRPWYVMFYIWEGGIVFYGGLLAATVVILSYLRAKQLPVMKFADILSTTIPVGLSFGRLGCTLNGCCFGKPAGAGALFALQFPRESPAWYYHVEHGLIPKTLSSSLSVHATQLYEWGGAWLIAAALFAYYRYHTRHGQVFAMLFVLYGPVRWIIESYRDHDAAERMLGWSIFWDPFAQAFMTKSQVVAIATTVVGLLLWAFYTKRGEPYAPKA
jgi:phosphatidylglycerol---prolipoprotein diacylglyceryl transferase